METARPSVSYATASELVYCTLVSGYHHHPSVRHLAIHQHFSLAKKSYMYTIQKNIRWSRLFIDFGPKKYTNNFLAIESDLIFSSIITTNIQKTLEFSNDRLYVAKRYRISQQKIQPWHIAILCSICAELYLILQDCLGTLHTKVLYNVKNGCPSEPISSTDMWWRNRSAKRRRCIIDKSEDTTE